MPDDSTRASKKELIEEVIREFRTSGNQDDAFASIAAERLGVSESDLRCLNIIENTGGLSAGELAIQSGLTAGAITGVTDRLEKAGYARRVPDPADRRRVTLQVTPAFDTSAERIWGPVAADWHSMLSRRFTIHELKLIRGFLRSTNDLGRRHTNRLRKSH